MFNNSKLDFIIGDVRDYQAMLDALVDVDYCIHTGAIKRIEVAEKQPMEAIKTNVIGSMNVIILRCCLRGAVDDHLPCALGVDDALGVDGVHALHSLLV